MEERKEEGGAATEGKGRKRKIRMQRKVKGKAGLRRNEKVKER